MTSKETARYDYTEQNVYVGIDVHKKTYTLVAHCGGVKVKKWTTVANIESVIEQLQRFFKGAYIYTVYEAGFSGYGLHRALIKAGIINIVVHAASIEVAANDKVKTDKRDATKLSLQLSRGQLRGIYIPSEEQERARLLSRHRSDLVKERTRAANRIKSKLYQFGLLGIEKPQVCARWLEEIKTLSMSEELRIILDNLIAHWLYFNKQIKGIEKHLKEQAKEQAALEKIYLSAPGIGPTSARMLANQLWDMRQFTSAKRLGSYTGLTPSEHSSGEKRRRGKITHSGPSCLRWILIEAAWVAIKKDRELAKYYQKLKERSLPQVAIVAIARRLILRIRACFRENREYEYITTPVA